MKNNVPCLFPGREKKKYFHQDSASSHTAAKTKEFFKERKVKYVSPEEWMPKSPNAAPMDFGILGILKRRLQKRKIYTLSGLKKALKQVWQKLE
jgi:hypothetical protein